MKNTVKIIFYLELYLFGVYIELIFSRFLKKGKVIIITYEVLSNTNLSLFYTLHISVEG